MDALLEFFPLLALLGFFGVVAMGVVAFFWPEVEGRLLAWLLRRRRAREARPLASSPFRRLAIRRPR